MKVVDIDSHSRPSPEDYVVEPFMSCDDRAKGSRSLTPGGLGGERKVKLKLIILCSMLLAAVAVMPVVSASAGYTLVDLGSLGGTTASPTLAVAINELGIMAGFGNAAVPSGAAFHAAVWSVSSSGVVTTTILGRGQALDINDQGEVVGLLQFSGPTLWRLKADGTFDTVMLPTLGVGGGGHVRSINNVGYAVGISGAFAALWHITPSGVTIQGFSDVDLRAINDNQEIAASSGGDAILLFTIQSDGSVTQQLLRTFPSGQFPEVTRINNAGAIVGAVHTETEDEFGDPGFHSEAFVLTKDGQMTILPPLATGGNAVARGINDRFQIVGFSDSHAVLWTPLSTGGYGVTDLGDIAIAFDINEAGRIAGFSGGHAALWWNPAEEITDLITLVRSFSLQPTGIETSLVAKLQNALAAINVGDLATACTLLSDFINEVQAQSGKKITVAQANQLITAANQIRAALGCP